MQFFAALLCFWSMCFWAASSQADDVVVADSNTIFELYSGFLNDASERRRRIVYTPYPVSARNGAHHRFVHVSDGSAAFARSDLFVDANMPLILRRAYHSNRIESQDFGTTGWRLSGIEQIRDSGDQLEYEYGNGTVVRLTSTGAFFSALDAFLTDVVDVERRSRLEIVVRTRPGIVKRFRKMGNYFGLVGAEDAFGNSIRYSYDNNQRLDLIESNSGHFVRIDRNASGNITNITDSHDRTVSYEYNSMQQLVAVVDMRGETWHYRYENGRLSAAVAPNGQEELLLAYDSSGQVSTSVVNGVASYFSYDGPVTSVRGDTNQELVFTRHATGLTSRVENAFGTITTVRFNNDGLPSRLSRNGVERARLGYDSRDALRRLRVDTATRGNRFDVRLDSLGRVTRVIAPDSTASFDVAGYYQGGVIPVALHYADDTAANILLDEQGRITSFQNRDGSRLQLARDGRTWTVTLDEGPAATLSFDEQGLLTRLRGPDRRALDFSYDPAGFREASVASDGGQATYHYNAAGTLFFSETGYEGEEQSTFAYVFGPNQRVDKITEDSSVEHIAGYTANGAIASFASPLFQGEITLGYDALGRLQSIARPNRTTAYYEYRDGEADIVAQLDKRATSYNQQREISHHGSRFDSRFGRVTPSNYGVLSYDERIGEIAVSLDPRVWTPMAHVEKTLAAIGIPGLLDGKSKMWEVAVPSNRLFVPPELWAVNCCFCLPCLTQPPYCQIP